MSPAHGRPPSLNPKKHAFQIRLSDQDIKILEKCQKTYGMSKAQVFIYGLKVLEMSNDNIEFRQLVDGIAILNELRNSKGAFSDEEYQYRIERQLGQIEFNFHRFLETYK